ncbi:MAG: hypothetical protein C4339_04825 [Nitrososphaerota archaeon]
MRLRREAADEAAFWLYLAAVALNAAQVALGLARPGGLSPLQALVIAGRSPLIFLATLLLACTAVLLEVLPHPVEERRAKALGAARNLLLLSVFVLAPWALAFAASGRSLGAFLGWFLDARYAILTPLFIALLALLVLMPSPRRYLRSPLAPLVLLLLLPVAPYVMARFSPSDLAGPTALAGALLMLVLLYVGYSLARRA